MTQNQGTILIIDDKEDFHKDLRSFLKGEPFQIISAYDTDDGWNKACQKNPDLIFLDVRFGDTDETKSFKLLEDLRSQRPEIPVVMITNYADIPKAVRAIKIGAYDFIQKGICGRDEIHKIVRNATETSRLKRTVANFQQDLLAPPRDDEVIRVGPLVARSHSMRNIFDEIQNIKMLHKRGAQPMVYIYGPVGSGKDTVAEAIAEEIGKPLRVIPSAYENLDDFKHALGGCIGYHDGRACDRRIGVLGQEGIAFLNDLQTLGIEAQHLLQPVLEAEPKNRKCPRVFTADLFPVRSDVIIIGSNRPLSTLVKEGKLLPDIRDRLLMARSIAISPLKERLEDVLVLADHFREKYNSQEVAKIFGRVDIISRNALWELIQGVQGNRMVSGSMRDFQAIMMKSFEKAGIDGGTLEPRHINWNIEVGIKPIEPPEKLSSEENALLLALKEITKIKWTSISTGDIKDKMEKYLPEVSQYKGQKIGALLGKFKETGIVTAIRHTEIGNVYDIDPEKLQSFLR